MWPVDAQKIDPAAQKIDLLAHMQLLLHPRNLGCCATNGLAPYLTRQGTRPTLIERQEKAGMNQERFEHAAAVGDCGDLQEFLKDRYYLGTKIKSQLRVTSYSVPCKQKDAAHRQRGCRRKEQE